MILFPPIPCVNTSELETRPTHPSAVDTVVGVDEAGCGALAGPVVAAAVVLGEVDIAGLTDSKRLSAKRRDRLDRVIRGCARHHAIGIAFRQEIDRINILQARLLAMQRAVLQLKLPDNARVMVDGTAIPRLSLPCTAVIGGDARIAEISAASILAKVFRDGLMRKYHERFPDYRFDRHKGYPTAAHKHVIKTRGLCAQHRRSFTPCRRLSATSLPPDRIKPL